MMLPAAGPASAGPASGGPASTGPASAGPASTGPASGVTTTVFPPPGSVAWLFAQAAAHTATTSVHFQTIPTTPSRPRMRGGPTGFASAGPNQGHEDFFSDGKPIVSRFSEVRGERGFRREELPFPLRSRLLLLASSMVTGLPFG